MADVERKGTWVPADYKPYLFVQCSLCAGRAPKSDPPEQCPHCGAVMSGGNTEGEDNGKQK